MPTPIKVLITGVDRVTNVVQSVNSRIEAMQKPAKDAQRAFARMYQLTGLNRLNEGFNRIRMSAIAVFRSIGQIVPVLGTITGAVTLAGMTRLVTEWANFGSNLSTTSQRLGVSSTELQKWQGAARLTGVSVEALNGGIQSLQDGMWDAVGGRNPQLVAAFQTLGISFRNANGSARNATDIMPLLANRIAAIRNPSAQAAVATQFFGAAGDSLLPFLRLGAAGMEHYRREAAQYGLVNDAGINSANRLREAQARLTLSVEGFGYSIAQAVEPVITPLINHMSMWIAQNRAWIATKISSYVSQLAAFIKNIDWQSVNNGAQAVWQSLSQLASMVGGFINTLGGFKAILFMIADILALRVAGSIFGLISPLTSLSMTILRVVIPAIVSMVAAGGPVVWIIAAIGGAAILLAAIMTGKFNSILKFAYNFVKGFLVTLNPFLQIPLEVMKHWDPTKGFFENLWNGIKGWARDALDYILWVVKKIRHAFSWFKNTALGRKLGLSDADNPNIDNSGDVDLTDDQRRDLSTGSQWNNKNWSSYVGKTGSARLEDVRNAVNQLTSKGWSKNAAIGLVANFDQESGLNPNAVGDNGQAYGIGQWHKDRQDKFASQFGHDIRKSTLQEQLEFANWELNNSEKNAGERLRSANSAAQAAGIVSAFYERPKDKANEIERRAGMANSWASKLQGISPEPEKLEEKTKNVSQPAAPSTLAMPETPAIPENVTRGDNIAMPMPMPQNNNQPLLLTIQVNGMPNGMNIKAQPGNSALQIQSISYQRSMSPEQSGGGI